MNAARHCCQEVNAFIEVFSDNDSSYCGCEGVSKHKVSSNKRPNNLQSNKTKRYLSFYVILEFTCVLIVQSFRGKDKHAIES